MKNKLVLPVSAALLSCAVIPSNTGADQIATTGGDQFHGKVISMTNDVVVIQSESLGQLTIPRSKVASISMTGTKPVSAASSTTPASTNKTVQAAAAPVTDLSSAIKQLNSDPAALKQVQEQYLAGSDAATKAKFNELLTGLQTGQINADGLRAQAQSAVDQLKNYKKELGPEAGDALNSYVAVLESFLKESGGGAVTNATSANP